MEGENKRYKRRFEDFHVFHVSLLAGPKKFEAKNNITY